MKLNLDALPLVFKCPFQDAVLFRICWAQGECTGLPGGLGSRPSLWQEAGISAGVDPNPADRQSGPGGVGWDKVAAGLRRGPPRLRLSGQEVAIHSSSVAEERGLLRGLFRSPCPYLKESHPALTLGRCRPSQSGGRPPSSTLRPRWPLPWLFPIGRMPQSCLTSPCSRGWPETSSSICWSRSVPATLGAFTVSTASTHWMHSSFLLSSLGLALGPWYCPCSFCGRSKMKHSGRKTWDDLARELMEIPPSPLFFFIQTRETPLVPGITGMERWLRQLCP